MDWPAYYEGFRNRRAMAHRRVNVALTVIINMYMYIMMELLQAPRRPIPYHTSALTGAQWVMELLTGHPNRIHTELGVSHLVFEELLQEMAAMGRGASRHVTLEEQLAIFLYMSVTGNTIRHAGERFQRSNDTISK